MKDDDHMTAQGNTGYAGGTQHADPVPVDDDYGYLEEAPIVEDDDYEPHPRTDEELHTEPPEEEPVDEEVD